MYLVRLSNKTYKLLREAQLNKAQFLGQELIESPQDFEEKQDQDFVEAEFKFLTALTKAEKI